VWCPRSACRIRRRWVPRGAVVQRAHGAWAQRLGSRGRGAHRGPAGRVRMGGHGAGAGQRRDGRARRASRPPVRQRPGGTSWCAPPPRNSPARPPRPRCTAASGEPTTGAVPVIQALLGRHTGVVVHRRRPVARPSGHARADGALPGVRSIHVVTLEEVLQHAVAVWCRPSSRPPDRDGYAGWPQRPSGDLPQRLRAPTR